MVDHSIDPARFGELEIHLDSCQDCRKAVAALALGSRSPSTPAVPFAGLELQPRTVILERYEVASELGHGGMGTVYLAHDRSLGRDVALKLHLVHASSERLQREAFAMAKLAHPNVVNVFEVSTYDDRVFVAMEYVKGGTLRTWLAASPRTWREIVAMLVEAGRGLAAAHAAGLVHRDFKPENVLVGEDGRPRVGDFGLARPHSAGRAPSDPEALAVALTVTGGLAGTPAYMAPEQIDGGDVGARCDQFAFCVVAWEALYGARPFTGTTLSSLHAAITKHDLPRPSSRVPDRVRRVVERGLHSDPAARFPDMTALLAALHAAATPRTARNVIVAVAAAVAIAGGAAAIVTTITARQRATGCERAAAAVHAPWSAPARAALAASFVATGKPLAIEAYERTAATLDRYASALSDQARATCSDRDQPERVHAARTTCLAQHHDELAAVVASLSHPTAGLLARGPDAAWALYDPSPCSDASVVTTQPHAAADLQRLAGVKAALDTGDYRGGVALGTTLLADARARKDQGLELDVLMDLAQLETELDPKVARTELDDAEALAEAQGRDIDAATMLDQLAEVSGTEAHDHPLAHHQLALARAKLARIGGNTVLEARLAFTEGQVFMDETNFTEAAHSMDSAIALFERAYGTNNPNVARAYGALSQILRGAGRTPEALVAARHTLEIALATLGPNHPTTAGAQLTLAQVLIDDQQNAEARRLLEQADATFARVYGAIHPARAAVQGNLVNLALTEQRWDDALSAATLAREILAASDGPDALSVAGPERDRSVALGALGRLPEALVAAQRALAIVEQAGADGEQRLAGALADLCEVEIAMARPADCIPHAQRAVAAITARGAATDPVELADARYVLARAMWEANHDRPRARRLAVQAEAEHPLAERRKVIADWLAQHR
ncbi:MAG: serine/threonine-protein kinase [Kofleriaceae bacterium]